MTRRALILAAALAALLAPATPTVAKQRLAFSGGPEGGTFQYFSNGISIRLSRAMPDVEVSNTASAGSLENLRRVDSGEADFGIVYSGDIFLGRNGKLTRDDNRYENVYVLGYLYGAPAHLVARANSGIDSLADLTGKRVAVGGAGSGAASAAQRLFTAVGLWGRMDVEFLGYSAAASAMGDRLIDAFWVLAGFPNSSVIQAAASHPITLIDIADEAETAGFFARYPFYTPLEIAGGIYRGVDIPTATFQDSALWVAGAHLEAELVETALTEIFSPAGLAFMVKVKSTARSMSVENGLDGVVTPIHPGAESFWSARGLEITADQAAR